MASLGFSSSSSPGFSMGSSFPTSTPGASSLPALRSTGTSGLNLTSFASSPAPSSGYTQVANFKTGTPFTQSTPSFNTSGLTSSINPSQVGAYWPTSVNNSYSSSGSGSNGLTAPNIPDATPVQAHIAEVVQASAARIGAMQTAIAQRAQAAQIGEMDQITAETLNKKDEEAIRAEQVSLNEQLKAVVAGTAGPSVAELQYQRTSEQAARQQMGYAAARGTGGNYGLAMREAGINQGLIQAQQSQGSAELRAQEVATARGQMADLQNQIRAADIAVATTEANFRQQANMFNAEQVNQAKIRQAELNQQANELNAQLGTQVSMFNAGQQNQATIRQAELETQTNMFNAGETNTTNRFNAGSENAADQFNSSLSAQIAATRAQMQSNTDQFNSTDQRIRQMADEQRKADQLAAATAANNQSLRDQQTRDFQAQEAQKQRDAQAAEDQKNRDARIREIAIQNATSPSAANGGAFGPPPNAGTDILGGAAGGAAAGAAIGGPWGGVVGGAVGGVGGIIKFGFDNKAYNDAINADQARKRAALIAAGLNPANFPTSQGGTQTVPGSTPSYVPPTTPGGSISGSTPAPAAGSTFTPGSLGH